MNQNAIIYPSNETYIVLDDLLDISDGSYFNDATVTATLYDSSDVAVTGPSFPLTLTYATGSDGRYAVTLPAIDADNLTAGATYRLEITVTEGVTTRAVINLQMQCRAKRYA